MSKKFIEIKAVGLSRMDFNFWQYDPQIGRFNSVDPLAANAGQDMISPYAAMGNAPEGKIDPDGTFSRGSRGAIAAQMHSTFTYGENEEAIADLAARLNNIVASIISDALSGGGGSSGSWSDGGSYQQEYTIVVEIPNLVDLLTGGCSMLGVTSNFVCNFSAGGSSGDGNETQRTATDAGHGNNGDPGAVDGTNYEKDYALKIETTTHFWLTFFGISNTRTRTGDSKNTGQYSWRYQAANNSGADVFVSFHLNSGTTSDAVYIIYQQGKSNETESISLAQSIANCLSPIMNVPSNAIAPVNQRTRFNNLAVLNGFQGRAGVLVEFGSIQNEANRNFINQNAAAIGFRVAVGIYQYLNNGQFPNIFLH